METQVILFMLVLTRVSGFVLTFPLFSGRNLPRTVKVGVTMVLTSLWFGVVDGDMQTSGHVLGVSSEPLSLVLALASELVVGGVIGFAFGLMMLPTRIAGAYIAQEMGLGLASLTSPNQTDSSNALAQLLDAVGVLVFFGTNMHHMILMALHASFKRLTVGEGIMPHWEVLVRSFADIHEVGLVVAAPVGICMFVTLVILFMLAKTSPQMNLFSVGMTVRLAAGLAALFLFMPEIVVMFQRTFDHAEEMVFGMW